MKRTLKLKLIESNDKPSYDDLVLNLLNKLMIYELDYYMEGFKVIKPIAISDEEIKVGDMVWYTGWGVCRVRFFGEDNTTVFLETGINNSIGGHVATTQIAVMIDKPKKIELLPEHFSNDILQLIVDGVLKDGSEIEVEYDKVDKFLVLDSNGKAIISIPESNFKYINKGSLYMKKKEPIVYSEEEVLGLILKYSKESFRFMMDNYDEIVEQPAGYAPKKWFEDNKKK